jgi:hypothetical protein
LGNSIRATARSMRAIPKWRQRVKHMVAIWVLRQIQDEFDAARIDCDLKYTPPVSGQRRTLIEQYYKTVDWTDIGYVCKVIQVYEAVLQQATIPSFGLNDEEKKRAKAEIEKLAWFLKRDGFDWTGERIVRMSGEPFLDDLKKAVTPFNAQHLADQIRRMQEAVENDPALAIGTAKELIETTCKTILAERGKPVAGTPDIPVLTKATLRELKLVPEGISDAVRGADTIKRLLSNLGTIGQALAELRSLYGTGHGKHGAASGLESRHARMAVGAASTLCTFLFETHSKDRR